MVGNNGIGFVIFQLTKCLLNRLDMNLIFINKLGSGK